MNQRPDPAAAAARKLQMLVGVALDRGRPVGVMGDLDGSFICINTTDEVLNESDLLAIKVPEWGSVETRVKIKKISRAEYQRSDVEQCLIVLEGGERGQPILVAYELGG